jgi:hypothetical protein
VVYKEEIGKMDKKGESKEEKENQKDGKNSKSKEKKIRIKEEQIETLIKSNFFKTRFLPY